MKKSFIKLIAVFVLIGILCGCNGGLFDPEYAITAPTDGIYRGVYEAVRQYVGKDIVLKYPTVQGVHTAYYPWDLDGDTINEVLVFYQLRSKGGVTRMQVLKSTENGWQTVQDLDAAGTDILNVDLCDLDGDTIPELCIGWSVATTTAHLMSVYQAEKGLLTQRASEEYSEYVLCDINNDKVQDLGLAVLSPETATSSLRFYTLKKGAVSLLGSIGLDGSVLSYGKITAAGITPQNTGVYLDVYKGADSMITELVYFKGGKLYNPFAGNQNNVNIATLRYCDLPCGDVNQDGSIEIPFMVPLPGYDTTKATEEDRDMTHYLLEWRGFDGQVTETVATWFYNTKEGYYVDLKGIPQGAFTAMFDAVKNEYVFYEWKNNKAGEPLLAIKTFPLAFFSEGAEYGALFKNETTVWGANIFPKGKEYLKLDDLKYNFHLIVT